MPDIFLVAPVRPNKIFGCTSPNSRRMCAQIRRTLEPWCPCLLKRCSPNFSMLCSLQTTSVTSSCCMLSTSFQNLAFTLVWNWLGLVEYTHKGPELLFFLALNLWLSCVGDISACASKVIFSWGKPHSSHSACNHWHLQVHWIVDRESLLLSLF